MKFTQPAIPVERKPQNESLWAMELAYQKGQQALIHEKSRELVLRRLFFTIYIALVIMMAGWGVYFYHLYKRNVLVKTANELRQSSAGVNNVR